MSMTRSTHAIVVCWGLWTCCAIAAGCASPRTWMKRGGSTEAGRATVQKIAPEACADEIVAHLNSERDQVHSWHCSGASIRITGVPIPLKGEIAAEDGRHFRLILASIAGAEADLGSNENGFWCWMREDPQKQIYYAAHDDAHLVQQKLHVPIDPDWIFEALGAEPLPDSHYELVRGLQPGTVSLVTKVEASNGMLLKKVIKVELARGVIVELALIDPAGQTLARAHYRDHRSSPNCPVVLPHQIELEWPATQQKIKLTMSRLEANPERLPDNLWEMPNMPGVQPCNLVQLPDRGVAR